MSYFNTKGKNIISHTGTNMGKTANENPRIPKLSRYKKDFKSTRASKATNYIYLCVFVSSFITIATTSPKAKTYII